MTNFLVSLFRSSMDSTDVPLPIRLGLISPAFKSGDKVKPENYRPISLTNHVSKVFERVIRPQMLSYLEEKGLFDDTNHGSRPGRSTLSQLLIQYNWTLQTLLQGDNVDLLYLDFQKAFDKVDFGILLMKLKNLGIAGKLGAWLGAFMMGRQQSVQVGDATSTWSEVVSGIPQGSVIGPYYSSS